MSLITTVPSIPQPLCTGTTGTGIPSAPHRFLPRKALKLGIFYA